MKKLSIIGKEYHTEEHAVGFYNAGDRVRYWGKLGHSGAVFGIVFAPRSSSSRESARSSPAESSARFLMGTVEGAAVGAAVGGAGACLRGRSRHGDSQGQRRPVRKSLKANKFLLIARPLPKSSGPAACCGSRAKDLAVHTR